MSSDNTDDSRKSIDDMTAQVRLNQTTPRPGLFTGRSAVQIGLMICLGLLAACIALSIAFFIVGIASPILVVATIILLVLAFKKPAIVSDVSARWPFRLLPQVVTSGPVRFAIILAVVMLPLSGVAGATVYGGMFSGPKKGNSNSRVAAAAVATATPSPAATAGTQVAVVATSATSVPTPAPAMVLPTPTPKPAPTPAPAKPTPTPKPTLTPAKPTMTTDQQTYVTDLYSKLLLMQNAITKVGNLSGQASDAPLLMLDPTWQQQMGTALGTMEGIYEASKDKTAPPGLEIINGKWIEMAGHCNLAADYISRGISQQDPSLMTQGANELNIASTNSKELSTLIQNFAAQFQ